VSPDGHAEKAEQAGIEAFLTKPVRASHLLECLQLVATGKPESSKRSGLLTRHDVVASAAQQRPRVLVAEDNLVNQTVIIEMLEALGYRVDLATNGREAVEATERNEYACVLMDCQMPDMNGYEATAAIREREKEKDGRRLAIIAVTAHAMTGDREKVLSAGMDDYMAKPITEAILASTMRRWLRAAGDGAGGRLSGSDEAAIVTAKPADQALDPAVKPRPTAVRAFLTDLPERQQKLRDALTRADAAGLRAEAHKLKGSCLVIGAPLATRTCVEIEAAAAAGDLTAAPSLLVRLDRELSVVDSRLRTDAASTASSGATGA
jgi:CheY-like chemotaxis protein